MPKGAQNCLKIGKNLQKMKKNWSQMEGKSVKLVFKHALIVSTLVNRFPFHLAQVSGSGGTTGG